MILLMLLRLWLLFLWLWADNKQPDSYQESVQVLYMWQFWSRWQASKHVQRPTPHQVTTAAQMWRMQKVVFAVHLHVCITTGQQAAEGSIYPLTHPFVRSCVCLFICFFCLLSMCLALRSGAHRTFFTLQNKCFTSPSWWWCTHGCCDDSCVCVLILPITPLPPWVPRWYDVTVTKIHDVQKCNKVI